MAALTKEKVQELEATHGKRIAIIRSAQLGEDGSPEWEIVLRPPKRQEYQMARAQLHGETATKAEAQELLVRRLCVWPDMPTLSALFEEWPALGEACGPALLALTGAQARADTKF